MLPSFNMLGLLCSQKFRTDLYKAYFTIFLANKAKNRDDQRLQFTYELKCHLKEKEIELGPNVL